MANDTLVNSYNRLDYKYNQTIPFLSAGYNSDDGIILGFSLKFINHGFRKTPYKNMHKFSLGHAFATKAFSFSYHSEYIGVLGRKTDLLTDIDAKGSTNITSFYGYGALSVYDKSKPDKYKYYWAKYNTGDAGIFLRKKFSDKVLMILGPAFQYYSLDSTDNLNKNILMTGTNGLDPATLYAKQLYLGGKYSFIVDTRNDKVLPMRGIYWQITLRHLSGLNDASYDLTQLNSDFTFHITLAAKKLVLVNRTGGGHNFSDFEFYQAQYLGSEDDLRGYRKYRFAGRSKFFNNTEMRWRMAAFKTYLFPAYFGLFAFYDTGRVWDDAKTSNKWLSGYGGGIWIAPLTRIVISFSYMASKEDKLPLIDFGWKF